VLIRIDPQSEAPIFDQIAASVRADLATGRAAPGDRLPGAREVAEVLGVNLHTVLRAYQELRDEGLVEMRRGRGATVTDAAAPLSELHRDVVALVEKARRLGLSPDTLASLVKESADGR